MSTSTLTMTESSTTKLNLNVFHDYDVRGIYGKDIDEEFYYHLGKAIATYIGVGTTIGVGHDARTSSTSLTASLITGLTDYGANVINLGLISTEIHYYVSGKYQYDANVMVTASHNPKEYNGAKIVLKNAVPLHGGFGLPEIKELVTQDISKPAQSGRVIDLNVIDEYVAFALSFINVPALRKLKVVVDTGNGVGGITWSKVLGKLGNVEVLPLFFEVDGTFPNHHPDPIKDENIQQLIAKVKDEKADLGIAIDGDADRIFFVDNEGKKLSGALTFSLFADYFLSRGNVGTYVYNASIGRIASKVITEKKGTPVRVRGGHAFFKQKMLESNAVFGGEHSGHFGYKEFYNSELTLAFGLMMIEILSDCDKKLSSWRKEFDVYPESGEINFKDADALSVLGDLKHTYKDEALEISEIDGTAFTFPDSWFIVRTSKTEPLMRLNMDADNKDILEKRLAQVIEIIETHGGVRK